MMEQYPYAPGAEVTKNAEVTLTVSSGPPKDAIEYTYNVVISPAEVGGTSEVHIVYSDARGENIDWGTKKSTIRRRSRSSSCSFRIRKRP
ncbi:hypothetical protein PACILC2_42350 [Paenibacillus cisolokensis]|uniref:Uncharacterized protein n=1 Tax=Paenibacillus cisolokensis TaxID=1658519 RepID=A0ABQ4NBT6_9BACL|nr:hypothetical protein PACILC2_42350 [Paenibacillus cisolokensis]